MQRRITAAVTTFTAIGLVAAFALIMPEASAEPATVTKYPRRASATRYLGPAFDTCSAPSLTAMTAWAASPYRAIGVYVGGPNRSCAQPNLTPQWVAAVAAQGWRLLPIYLGLQAPCSDRVGSQKITPSMAVAQGTASAVDAISSLTALGLQPGSIVYGDLENYTATSASCRTAVLDYLSGFARELHRQGYLCGVYANLSSGAAHLSAAYLSTSFARPDALWVARWDGQASLSDLAGIANIQWSIHQRAKQYLGDHDETYGAVTLNIDSDWLDAPVATIAQPQFITTKTQFRSAPTKSATAKGAAIAGIQVQVICQAPGAKVAASTVWDKLSNGWYISDQYLDTPSKTGYSNILPRCSYPYQVKPANGTAERSNAGARYPKKGIRYAGALAWIVCQKTAAKKTGSTTVWDRLDNGAYLSDYAVATFSKTSYTSPIPRC